jgi:hypothetical protein
MKTCVLFSGGWDSIAMALKAPFMADLLFFNYGQIYLENELKVAQEFARRFRRNLRVETLSLHHDIERRNFYLLIEAKRLGYTRIFIGSRKIAPPFERYKDINWLSVKLFCYLINVKVCQPLTGWRKWRVVRFVRARTDITPYNCYNNNTDYKTCPCSNCLELKHILAQHYRC